MARELAGLSGILVAALLATACRKTSDRDNAAPPTAAPLASKAFYRVDAAPLATCAANAVCEAKLELRALGAYHVNKDYPFKFEASPAVSLDGAAAFTLDDAKRGTLTIRFRAPASAGTANVAGVFKLSVCSDDTCEIEKPEIALTVPVT